MNVSSPSADDIGEAKQGGAAKAVEAPISRRIAVGGVAFFGAAMSAIASHAFAQPVAPGSYSNSAIAAEPPGSESAKSEEDMVRAVKIERAMRSGPRQI